MKFVPIGGEVYRVQIDHFVLVHNKYYTFVSENIRLSFLTNFVRIAGTSKLNLLDK